MIVAALQPIVGTHSRRVVAMEALARWAIPDGHRFETPAERLISGDIDWKQVDLQVVEWLRSLSPLPVPIHVNLSPETMECGTAWERWLCTLQALDRAQPAGVLVEISERIASSRMSLREVAKRVAQIRKSGARVGLDDADGCHESMFWMKAIRWDVVKIDWRSGCHSRTNGCASEIIAWCWDNGIRTVLEGIENESDMALARMIRPCAIQGMACGGPAIPAEYIGPAESAIRMPEDRRCIASVP